jgi:hypothetical protein
MPRVLVFATTTGYQLRAFDDAASLLGIDLQLATDRCEQLDDPWRDRALAVRFHELDASITHVVDWAGGRHVDGVLAVGDRPAVLAAHVAQRLGISWHTPEAASASRHKLRTREALRDAGLRVPAFASGADAERLTRWHPWLPVVVKPVVLSGSRGVIRADTPEALASAVERVERLLATPDVRAMRDPDASSILIEQFIPGREYALEAVLVHGRLQTLALFDKPDPLDGPFFEETLYVTPSRASAAVQEAIVRAVQAAASALGLMHGPIHAECRVNPAGVYVLEVAARPIGGRCARALQFVHPSGATSSLEAVLLRQAIGEPIDAWQREPFASGVMMIPIPGGGVLRGVDGVDAARALDGIRDVQITAKPDQALVPLPEGATYLGFIFAQGPSPADVESRLRAAHRCLHVRMDRLMPVVGP